VSIEIKNITKRFGKFTALDDVSLNIPEGQLTALLGPSGSGKTTLLRVIAGLERPDQTEPLPLIKLQGIDVSTTPVGARGLGFVFQHYALFRHMTIFDNIAFGLQVRPRKTRPSRKAIQSRVRELLKLIQLEGIENRYPSQLSGGQRQRVALARALAVEPKLLLLDEPFGALDAKVRLELRRWLRRLHDEIGITSVFVTHDQEEALEVADLVVVMNKGKIVQEGTANEVFHNPANEFVMQFLGHVNLFHGRVEEGKAVFGSMAVEQPGAPNGSSAKMFVRPYEVQISRTQSESAIPAKIVRIQSAGPQVRIELTDPSANIIQADIPHTEFRELKLNIEEHVFVSPRRARVFVADYSI